VEHSRLKGAFGSFTRSKEDVQGRLRSLREKCRKAHLGRGPNVGSYPNLDKLRHLYADALQLSVVFQPLKGWMPVKTRDGKGHLENCLQRSHQVCSCRQTRAIAFLWKDNPIWGHAPPGAIRKRTRFCSLLNLIVENGHFVDLSHDLVRLAKIFWSSSMKNFLALCRRIVVRITTANESFARILKSPEPKPASERLGFNPALCRVDWNHTRRGCPRKDTSYVPRYVPPWRRNRLYTEAGDSLKTLLGLVAWPQDS
jgi:hypothetical protein